MLQLQPITFPEAAEFVTRYHRHHSAPVGWKFGIAVSANDAVVGVVMVGRPVARRLDTGWTLEVTRCCTDGAHNAASMLYGAAWRATKALGYRRLVTYTLPSESGSSLRAAGYVNLYTTPGRSWSVPTRPRVDTHPLGQKLLWERVIEPLRPCAIDPVTTPTGDGVDSETRAPEQDSEHPG